MLIVSSRSGVPVRLTKERWQHVIFGHPEMDGQRDRVLETISDPDVIQQGDFGELLAIRYYAHTPLMSKFLVVVYKEVSEEDGFVLTAYFTSRPSERRVVIWKR